MHLPNKTVNNAPPRQIRNLFLRSSFSACSHTLLHTYTLHFWCLSHQSLWGTPAALKCVWVLVLIGNMCLDSKGGQLVSPHWEYIIQFWTPGSGKHSNKLIELRGGATKIVRVLTEEISLCGEVTGLVQLTEEAACREFSSGLPVSAGMLLWMQAPHHSTQRSEQPHGCKL